VFRKVTRWRGRWELLLLGRAAPTAAGALTAEAVVQHARKSERMPPAAAPAPDAEIPEAVGRWPAGVRILVLIGGGVVCWAIVLLAIWWLVG
jgi:hypothetical protein